MLMIYTQDNYSHEQQINTLAYIIKQFCCKFNNMYSSYIIIIVIIMMHFEYDEEFYTCAHNNQKHIAE